VHEVAEEMVVRPLVREFVGESETQARDREEAAAAEVLKQLERLDAGSPEFQEMIAQLKQSVGEHAGNEESQEFPALVQQCTQEHRLELGKRLKALEQFAPTHPHPKAAGSPAALLLTGPFAAMLDRVRDAITG
jgi:hemerythrin superfamily protein